MEPNGIQKPGFRIEPNGIQKPGFRIEPNGIQKPGFRIKHSTGMIRFGGVAPNGENMG